ncbi:MAG: DNA-binding protein [Spartobacteria bacterium]|nr:DNA-binding protein [Spartobacteria bacterium]
MNVKYLTEQQLAELTGRSVKSWQRDRIRGGGVPFIRCGGKILYDMEDVSAWMNSRKYSSTSEYNEVRA